MLNSHVVTALTLILLAAVLNGAYAIPMKFMRGWSWENTWLAFTIVSFWALPLLILYTTVPHPIEAYSEISWNSLLWMNLMSLLWGIGSLLIGRSFPMVGVSVGYGCALACSAAVGSILPLLTSQSGSLFTPTGRRVLLGIGILIVGVGICGFAGRQRERSQGSSQTFERGQALRGCLLASVGGSLGGALNLAFVYGAAILRTVERQRPATSLATIAIWIPAMAAGGVPGALYTAWLLRKHRTFVAYKSRLTGVYLLLVILMSSLFLGSVLLYGNATGKMGALGPVIGWPVFMSGAIVASAIWGALFGEWNNSGTTARVAMIGGAVCLVIAMVVLGKAGS